MCSLNSRDVQKTLSHKTETVNLQDRDETETYHFFKLSRPRRDETFNLQDRDNTETFQKTSRYCLETETFKTETTSLLSSVICADMPLRNYSLYFTPTHTMITCAKFRLNPSANCRDITRHDIDVNGQRPARQTDNPNTWCCPFAIVDRGVKTVEHIKRSDSPRNQSAKWDYTQLTSCHFYHLQVFHQPTIDKHCTKRIQYQHTPLLSAQCCVKPTVSRNINSERHLSTTCQRCSGHRWCSWGRWSMVTRRCFPELMVE